MLITWFVGAVISIIVAGLYCEVHNVDTSNIAARIFFRSLFWPLFIVNGIIWGTGLAIAVVYGHCIAPAVRDRFRRN